MNGLSSLPKFIVEQIGKLLSAGTPVDEIADILEIDVSDVREYIESNQTSGSNRRDKYKVLISDMEEHLDRLAIVAQDSPKDHNIQNSYIKMLGLYRDTLDKHEKVSDPTKFVAELVDEVINPLIIDIAKLIVSSGKDFKMDMGARSLWDPRMDPLMNEFISKLGSHISSLNKSAVNNLNQVFSADYVLDGESNEIN